MMNSSRRDFIRYAAGGTALTLAPTAVMAAESKKAKSKKEKVAAPESAPPGAPAVRNRIGVSTYSFWHFTRQRVEVADCIDRAAAMGFDAVEILHRQMSGESNDYLQSLKRRAFVNGLDLNGLSIHQGFLSPDAAVRRKNIDHT